jgi:hypothetical protein
MNESNQVNFAVLVKDIKDNILAHCEYQQLNARIQRAKYEALVKEGFTRDEALTLCAKV